MSCMADQLLLIGGLRIRRDHEADPSWGVCDFTGRESVLWDVEVSGPGMVLPRLQRVSAELLNASKPEWDELAARRP